jgi:hypothetical protein
MRPSRTRTQWGRRLYPDPALTASFEEFARTIHADLAMMDAADSAASSGWPRSALADDSRAIGSDNGSASLRPPWSRHTARAQGAVDDDAHHGARSDRLSWPDD